MLAYITIGTNDFQRSVDFYDAIFNVLGYSRLPAWTESWAMWGDKNNPEKAFSFCICPPFDGHSATAGNGTMFAFQADNAEIVRQFHAAGLLAGGQNEGAPGTRPAYGPTFMWPTCAILTGISWHAFVSIILPQLISSSTRNRRFAYSILRFCAFTAPDVK